MASSFFEPRKAFSWNPEQYIPPFEDMGRTKAPTWKEPSLFFGLVSGVTTSATKPQSTLSSSVLRALQRMFLITMGYGKGRFGGYGFTDRGAVLVQVPHITGEEMRELCAHADKNREYDPVHGYTQCYYNPNSGGFLAADIAEDGTRTKLSFGDSETCFYMAAILYGIYHVTDDEYAEAERNWEKFCFITEGACYQDLDPADEEELQKVACILSDNIYRRVKYCREVETVAKGMGIKADASRIGLLETKHFDKIHLVNMKGFIDGIEGLTVTAPKITSYADEEVEAPSKISELRGRYKFSDVELNEEEQAMIPDVPARYQIPDEVIEVCEFIKESSDYPNPLRNFVFCGPTGCGKTEAVRMVPFALGKPLLHQACGPHTQGPDLSTQAIPDPSGSGKFVFTEGPLIEALEKGYCVEVSEADAILKEGVLKEFNPLFDATGTIKLANGRIVKRHPDAVVIYTCNCYESDLEPSVKNRCTVFEFRLPDDDTLVERVMKESNYHDETNVRKMVDVLHRVIDYITSNNIPGDVGVRNLINWATTTAINGRAWHNSLRCIVCHPTCTPEEKEEVRQALLSCVEVQFPPEEVTLPW